MDKENYQVDKLAIIQEQESRAVQKVKEIEQKCSVSVVSFMKNNYSFPKIRTRRTEPEIKFLIGTMLAKIAVMLGLKEIESIHKPDIINAILNQYSDLTIEEVYKAFELERYNVYDVKTEHYQLFNAEYVTAILKKYKTWKHNIKMHHNIAPDSQKTAAISEEEKDKIVENGVNRFYEEYKASKTIEDPSEYIFDHLIKKGVIKNNNNPKLLEYYQNHLQLAKDQLKKEHAKNNLMDAAERQRLKIDLEQIIAGHSPKIILRAKKNILAEFFEKQILLKTEKIF